MSQTEQWTEERIYDEVMLPHAQLGIPLILAPPGSRNAVTKGWPERATTDPDRLHNMAKTVVEGGHSIYAVTAVAKARSMISPIIVLDIDNKNGRNGTTDWEKLERLHGSVIAPTKLTPTGGLHRFFWSNDRHFSGRGQLPKSIDLPPGVCIFRDGQPYPFEDGLSFDDVEPTELPPWLLEKLSPKHGGNREKSGRPPTLSSALAQVAYYLSKLDPARADEYEDWIHVGMATYHSLERYKSIGFNLGLSLWDGWSHQSSKYESGVCASHWKTFDAEGGETMGLGSLREWCKLDMRERGEKFHPPKVRISAVDSEELIEVLAALGYTFRLNLMGAILEVSINQKRFEPISDPLRFKIRTQLRDNGYNHGHELTQAEDAWYSHALDNSYHPIRDWMKSLNWDGEDHITKLSGYFSDKGDIFPVALKRWLVGSVAKIMRESINEPGIQVWMLVLLGPQGLGKSYLAEWLSSPQPVYFHEGGINPHDKDDRIR